MGLVCKSSLGEEAKTTPLPEASGKHRTVGTWAQVALTAAGMPEGPKLVRQSTFVAPERTLKLVRLVMPKAFIESSVWTDLRQRPFATAGRFFGVPLFKDGQWIEQTIAGETILVGYVQVEHKHLDRLLKNSGQHGCFVERLARDQPARQQVVWVAPEEDVGVGYLAKVRKAAGSLPLAFRKGGGASLGYRVPVGQTIAAKATWRVRGVPIKWNSEDLCEAINGAGFTETTVISPGGRQKPWLITAHQAADEGQLAILVEAGSVQLQLERLVGRRDVSQGVTHKINPAKPPRPNKGGAEADKRKGDDGGGDSAAKRLKADGGGGIAQTHGEAWWRIRECGGQGHCMYNAIAVGYHMATDGTAFDKLKDQAACKGKDLRFKLAEHIAKYSMAPAAIAHAEGSVEYKNELENRQTREDGEEAETWDEYLKSLYRPARWGDELALRAAARRLGVRITCVVGEIGGTGDKAPQLYMYGKAHAKLHIALLWEAGHYSLLECKPGHNWPAEWQEGFRGGAPRGGAKQACSGNGDGTRCGVAIQDESWVPPTPASQASSWIPATPVSCDSVPRTPRSSRSSSSRMGRQPSLHSFFGPRRELEEERPVPARGAPHRRDESASWVPGTPASTGEEAPSVQPQHERTPGRIVFGRRSRLYQALGGHDCPEIRARGNSVMARSVILTHRLKELRRLQAMAALTDHDIRVYGKGKHRRWGCVKCCMSWGKNFMDVERSLVNGVEAQCEGPAGRDRHIKSPSFWLYWHRTTHKVRDQLAAFFSLSPQERRSLRKKGAEANLARSGKLSEIRKLPKAPDHQQTLGPLPEVDRPTTRTGMAFETVLDEKGNAIGMSWVCKPCHGLKLQAPSRKLLGKKVWHHQVKHHGHCSVTKKCYTKLREGFGWRCDVCQALVKGATVQKLGWQRSSRIRTYHPDEPADAFTTLKGKPGRCNAQVLPIHGDARVRRELANTIRDQLVAEGIEPHPGPSSSSAHRLQVASLNCGGITSTFLAMDKVLNSAYDVICVQETRLDQQNMKSWQQGAASRGYRSWFLPARMAANGTWWGGLALAIKDTIPSVFEGSVREDSGEILAVQAAGHSFVNVWQKPSAVHEGDFHRSLAPWLAHSDSGVVIGDWNQLPDTHPLFHDGSWALCVATDSEGRYLPTRWNGSRSIDYGFVRGRLRCSGASLQPEVYGDHIQLKCVLQAPGFRVGINRQLRPTDTYGPPRGVTAADWSNTVRDHYVKISDDDAVPPTSAADVERQWEHFNRGLERAFSGALQHLTGRHRHGSGHRSKGTPGQAVNQQEHGKLFQNTSSFKERKLAKLLGRIRETMRSTTRRADRDRLDGAVRRTWPRDTPRPATRAQQEEVIARLLDSTRAQDRHDRMRDWRERMKQGGKPAHQWIKQGDITFPTGLFRRNDVAHTAEGNVQLVAAHWQQTWNRTDVTAEEVFDRWRRPLGPAREPNAWTEFTATEIQAALKRGGAAAGITGWTAAEIQHIPYAVVEDFTALLNGWLSFGSPEGLAGASHGGAAQAGQRNPTRWNHGRGTFATDFHCVHLLESSSCGFPAATGHTSMDKQLGPARMPWSLERSQHLHGPQRARPSDQWTTTDRGHA